MTVLRRWYPSILVYSVLIVAALLFLFPYWWMLISSVRDQDQIFNSTRQLGWSTIWPESISLHNYARLLTAKAFGRSLLVSLLNASLVTAGALVICTMAGYAFARLRFPGSRLAFLLALSTFMLPVEATVIPLFIEIRMLGWLNTLQALVVPFLASGFGIFLFRQFIADLPVALDEAAMIDGCSWFSVYRRIILPQLGPAIVTMGILTFSITWNSFFWPLIATRGEEWRVAQLTLAHMASDIFESGSFGWGGILAACTLLVMPLMIAFIFLQRYYVRGVALSGFK